MAGFSDYSASYKTKIFVILALLLLSEKNPKGIL